MMYAVIRRGDEQPLQYSKLGHMLSMNPELIDQIQTHHRKQNFCRKSQYEEGQVKQESVKIDAGLAQRRAQIVVFTLVVGDMGAPEQGDFMAEAVLPIVGEVIQQEAAKPDPQLVVR